MDVVVIGGHGKVARRLLGLLLERGHGARGVIRNPDHAADLESLGAESFVCDIEAGELTGAVRGADAVVFAAGAGPGSGAERKQSVDYGGAVKLIEACRANQIRRYVMVSSINADDPKSWSEKMRPYFEAKAAADTELERAGLDHTIARPGFLSDEPGTGKVTAAPEVPRGEIPRDDVALVLAEVLEADSTIGKAFDVVSGETPVKAAIAAL